MTRDELIAELWDVANYPPHDWRNGQTLFNYAARKYPEATERLRSTMKDCFYQDAKIPAFIEALAKDICDE